ncbi:hypothetical protein [Paucilactobacillus nenjiangensis]|uniref:hypothetical protein n=1 Tax=Paucilactobacillus nenjiangensis TaxID=1296540 RepID=UPI0028D904B6|nr:hypothetical protein [Paucilactobacillus nenjiangensis]
MDYGYGIGRQISRKEANYDGIPFDELELFNSKTRRGDQKAVVAIMKYLQSIQGVISWDDILTGATCDELFSETERKAQIKYTRYHMILAMRNLELAGLTNRIGEDSFELTKKGKKISMTNFDVWEDVYKLSIVELYHLHVYGEKFDSSKTEFVFNFKIKNLDN